MAPCKGVNAGFKSQPRSARATRRSAGKCVYKLSPVRKTVKAKLPNADQLYGFNLIGVHGYPLVQFSYATEDEAQYLEPPFSTLSKVRR